MANSWKVIFQLLCISSIECGLIHLISMNVGDQADLGYNIFDPAIEVALQKVAVQYPRVYSRIRRHNYYVPGNYSCEESSAEIIKGFRVIYELGHDDVETSEGQPFPVILAPGCSFEVVPLADLSRELDIALLASTASVLIDRQRYPTGLSLASTSYANLANSLLMMLQKFGWNRVSILAEHDGVTYGSAGAEVMFGIVDKTFKSQTKINVLYHKVDITDSRSTRNVLEACRIHSTVVIAVFHPMNFKTLLKAGDQLGMATGEFVFILAAHKEFDPIGQILYPNLEQVPATAEFAFFSSFGEINWDAVTDEMHAMAELSKTRYNWDVSEANVLNTVTLSMLESILMFAEVANNTLDTLSNMSGREFISRFIGKTFKLSSRDVMVAPSGARVNDIAFKQVRASSMSFKTVLRFNAIKRMLEAAEFDIEWSQGAFPPPVVPACGLRNEICQQNQTTVYAASTIAVIVLIALFSFFYYRKLQKEGMQWVIPETLIELKPTTVAAEPIEILYNGQPATVIPLDSSLTLNDVQTGKMAKLLNSMYQLNHPNLATFHGLHWSNVHKCMYGIVEYCKKANVRVLLRNEELELNWDFRYSLIRDVVRGLTAIHKSKVRYHGELSSVNCYLDGHFTVKIALHGFDRLRKSRHTRDKNENAWDTLSNAPELGDGMNGPMADIFSFGVILYEIITISTPFGISEFASPEEIAMARRGYIDPNFCTNDERISPELGSLIRKCWSSNPIARPDMKEIDLALRKIYPGIQRNLIDSLIKRLAHYSHELEAIVYERTKTLQAEMQRVDSYLCELMPPEIAKALRETQHIEPVFFDSVSVSFSDIPILAEICAEFSPGRTMSILDELCGVMDRALSNYDVYKVENIRDCYMITSGVPNRNGDKHAAELVRLGLHCIKTVCEHPFLNLTQNVLKVRVGINSGPCMAGVVGSRLPHYSLFGDTVNTASRMSTNGQELVVQVSKSTADLVAKTTSYHVIPKGCISVKGKGDIDVFWIQDGPGI